MGVVLDQDIKNEVIEVERKSSRIMRIKLAYGQEILNVICANAPQIGCSEEENNEFWLQMDEVQRSIPEGERCIIGADLNGHIGSDNRGGAERVHSGKGMGIINEEGESVLDFAMSFDFAIQNTFFTKRTYRTYKSGDRESQIDFLLC